VSREAECEQAAQEVQYSTNAKIAGNTRLFNVETAAFKKEVSYLSPYSPPLCTGGDCPGEHQHGVRAASQDLATGRHPGTQTPCGIEGGYSVITQTITHSGD
jgi:hypothetical protein